MKLSLSNTRLVDQTKDLVIVFYLGENSTLTPRDAALKKEIAPLLGTTAFKGEAGQVALLSSGEKHLLLAGLGAPSDFHNGLLERAAAAATRAGVAAGFRSFSVAAECSIKGLSEADHQLLVGRGAAWGAYEFDTFKSKSAKKPSLKLTFRGAAKKSAALKTARAQGEALVATADVANLPGNAGTPTKIADWARQMAREEGLTCQTLGVPELKKKGCGGVLSVASGSAEPPRVIILKHKGADPKARPIVLVGKTVTFDSGGISLKPGKRMGWMKYDKCGGMAVLAAMQMIARMNVKTPVVGILGAAENMPGSKATRPGDIITAYKGKTVEVLNTDAEGRLVLMDAIGIAADMKPRAIVDLATLTGACVVALGSAASAILGNDQALVDDLIRHGATAGERLWQLPLYKEYADDMKSDFADLSNISKSGGAGTATAAAFLREFVPEGTPWAHLDIAGVAWQESPKPHQAPGATLFGARTLAQWVDSLD